MEVLVSKNNFCEMALDTLIVPVFEDRNFSVEYLNELYDYAQNKLNFTGKYLEFINIPTFNKNNFKTVLFCGIGKNDEFNLNKLRVVFSKAFQEIQGKNLNSVAVLADNMLEDIKNVSKNIIEGAFIGLYKFNKYKSKKNENEKITKIVLLSDKDNDAKDGVRSGELVACAVNFARDLINEPAEVVTPSKLAEIASKISNLEVKIYGKNEAKELGMGAFLAVGQGSRHEPKFIHMKYSPSGVVNKKIVLVGKGITFDSGGLDLKPPASMLEMKGDMAGAAAVLAIMRTLSVLKPNLEVHGLIAACENMPNSAAYKPGDVLTAMNGKTIEVDNTDAEGRLTLADALCYAETLKPDVIIDIATLTGACCVALGKVASGLMGNNDSLIETLQFAAEDAGEYLWEMPMYEEYFDDMKSDIADFKNAGSRYGGTSAAALFLKNFVQDTPWAHIDIAGTSILSKPLREFPKGATGVGVRTILNYICNL